MPFYCYQAVDKQHSCAKCSDGFEVLQKLSDAKLTVCPECGNKVKKMIVATNLALGISSGGKQVLSEKNIAKNGFTRYRKVAKGQYEKTAGKGPEIISAD